MEVSPSSVRSLRWSWALWALAALSLLAGSFAAESAVGCARQIYIRMELKELPFRAQLILYLFDRVPAWILAVALAVSGIPIARSGDAKKTDRWALIMIFLLLLIGVGLISSLLEPIVRIRSCPAR